MTFGAHEDRKEADSRVSSCLVLGKSSFRLGEVMRTLGIQIILERDSDDVQLVVANSQSSPCLDTISPSDTIEPHRKHCNQQFGTAHCFSRHSFASK